MVILIESDTNVDKSVDVLFLIIARKKELISENWIRCYLWVGAALDWKYGRKNEKKEKLVSEL